MTNLSKFVSSLSNNDGAIKTKRAAILASSTEAKQTALINALKDKINTIDLEIENLTDLAPDNTYSLKPGGSNYDPQAWVTKLQQLKLDRFTVSIELDIAVDTYNEWFAPQEEAEAAE